MEPINLQDALRKLRKSPTESVTAPTTRVTRKVKDRGGRFSRRAAILAGAGVVAVVAVVLFLIYRPTDSSQPEPVKNPVVLPQPQGPTPSPDGAVKTGGVKIKLRNPNALPEPSPDPKKK